MADEISPNENPENQASHGAVAEEDRWLDRPSSINLIIKVLVAACTLSVLADFFYHKHADYSFQEWIAFDAVFGFVAYVGLVTTAKGLRRLLMRDEDYYD
jgi:hypothetical protein